jgi:predicted secreted protein
MKKRLLIFSVSAVAVLLVGIFIASRPAAVIEVTQSDMEQAAESQNGLIVRDVIVSQGETFIVKLYAAGSAGMRWSVSFTNPAVAKQDGAREFTGGFIFGGRNGEEWTFKAVGVGTAVISMSYASVGVFDTPPPVINRLTINVTVE